MSIKSFLFALPLCLPIAAAAQPLLDAKDAFRLAGLIRSEGYPVEVTTDSLGDPMIEGKISGGPFFVFFYDCKDNANCLTVQFKTAYDMTSPMSMTMVNDFNASKRYVSVHLDDEGDPHLTMDMNIDYGVTEENFVDNFKIWVSVQDDFEKFIDW